MSKTKPNKRLYEVAKACIEASLSDVFSEFDLIGVRSKEGIPYYVTIVSNAIAAYRGEAGLTGYLALAMLDEESSALEQIEIDLSQEALLAIFTDEQEELEEEDRKALRASGVSFTDAVPQFRLKERYRYPWRLSRSDEEDMILIMEALLFAKEYFASFEKKRQSDSFGPWLDSLGIAEEVGREWLPCVSKEGEGFVITARLLIEENFGFVYPQAYFRDEERQLHFKRLKARRGKILYYITGTMVEPVLGQRDERPLFPTYAITFDPQTDQILDFLMVEDYEKEHAKFVESLLNLFEEHGKVQAIHCFGRRTLPLLEKIGPQMGIMVVDGGKNELVDELVYSMFDELTHMHEGGHGPHCDHDHD